MYKRKEKEKKEESFILSYKGSKWFFLNNKYAYEGSNQLKYYLSKTKYYYFTRMPKEKLINFFLSKVTVWYRISKTIISRMSLARCRSSVLKSIFLLNAIWTNNCKISFDCEQPLPLYISQIFISTYVT